MFLMPLNPMSRKVKFVVVITYLATPTIIFIFWLNSFLDNLSLDIDECKQDNKCEKAEYCYNTVGSYNCKCPKGYHGDGTTSTPCISNIKPWLIPVLATAGNFILFCTI